MCWKFWLWLRQHLRTTQKLWGQAVFKFDELTIFKEIIKFMVGHPIEVFFDVWIFYRRRENCQHHYVFMLPFFCRRDRQIHDYNRFHRFTSFGICWNTINTDLPSSSVVWISWRSHQSLPFRWIVNVCHQVRIFRSQILMLYHLTISFCSQKGR